MMTPVNKRSLSEIRSSRTWISLLVSLVAFGAGWAALTPGHQWGDDFALYVMQAQSLVQGEIDELLRQGTITVRQSRYWTGPVLYPWGYPLLLAPVVAIWGGHIQAIKMVSVIAFSGTAALMYAFYCRRFASTKALLLTLMIAVNPIMLKFLNNTESDIVFLFLAMLALTLLDAPCKGASERRPLHIWLAVGGIAGIASAVRPNGVLLLPVIALAQFLEARSCGLKVFSVRRADLVRYLAPYAVVAVVLLAVAITLPGGEGSHVKRYLESDWSRLPDNALYYAKTPVQFFGATLVDYDLAKSTAYVAWQSLLENGPLGIASSFISKFSTLRNVFGWLAYWVTVPFLLCGIATCGRRDAPALVFAGLNLLLYVGSPFREIVRYFIPMVPLYILFIATGTEWCWKHLATRYATGMKRFELKAWVFLTLVFLASTIVFVFRPDRPATHGVGPYDALSQDMFAFVRQQSEPTDLIVFFKPRAMRLLSGRSTVFIDPCDTCERCKYYAVHKFEYPSEAVFLKNAESCKDVSAFEPVFSNPAYTVYTRRQKTPDESHALQ